MHPTDQDQHRGSAGSPPAQPTLGRYVACYALYAVVLLGCYLNFWVWRLAVQDSAQAITEGQLSRDASYAFPMLIVGLVLFGVAIWTEESLRSSVPKGRLRATFTRIAVRLLIAALVAVVISQIVLRLVPAAPV